jgi:hypothetical protein
LASIVVATIWCFTGILFGLTLIRAVLPTTPDAESHKEVSVPVHNEMRVLVYRVRMVCKLHNPGAHVTFNFWIYNGSQVPVAIRRIDGPVKWQGQELSGNLELVSQTGPIPPGQSGRLTIKQRIPSDDDAKQLASIINKPHGVIFSFNAARLILAANGLESAWPLPDVSRETPAYERIRWGD